MTGADFRRLLARDEADALAFERVPEAERRARRLARPATNLGGGRGRFRVLFEALEPLLAGGVAACDVGVYPGTTLRIARTMPGGDGTKLVGLGLGLSDAFRGEMSRLGVRLHELEFDVRLPPPGAQHLLSCDVESIGGPFDICVCTEVIEHQLHPVSLLVGLNRITSPGATVLMTTNSVSFFGDIAKLAVGHHNVETLERSHVVSDSDWRAHIRLYTRGELTVLMERAGFAVTSARYFDNGNVYAGRKGALIGALRGAAALVPHLRSHVFIEAQRVREPEPSLIDHLERLLSRYGLQERLGVAAEP